MAAAFLLIKAYAVPFLCAWLLIQLADKKNK